MGVCARPAYSCRCETRPIDEAFDNALEASSMILCGRVINKEIRKVDQGRLRAHTVLVQASWKGTVPDTLLVWSPVDEGKCGVDLPTDVDMLLFTHEDSGKQHTGQCSLKTPMPIAFFERYRLGEPRRRTAAFYYKVLSLGDLFEVATARDERVRLRAAKSLGALTADRDVIVPRLISMLKSQSPNSYQSAVYALASMRNAPPQVEDALDDALHSGSEERRLEAYSTIYQASDGCPFFPYALKGLADKSDEIRSFSAKRLRNIGTCLSDDQKRALLKAIESAMEDAGATTKCDLIKGLEECGCIASDWIPKLEKMKAQAKDKGNWVGYCAGQAAAKLRKACQ